MISVQGYLHTSFYKDKVRYK